MFRDSWRVWLERRARQAASGVVAAIAAFGFVLLLQYLGLFTRFELIVYDQILHFRAQDASIKSPVRIVFIRPGDSRLQTENGSITDAGLYDLLDRIAAEKPRVIGLDILRSKPSADLVKFNDTHPDTQLIWVETPNYPNGSGASEPVKPQGVNEAFVGFDDYPLDSDGTTRRATLTQSTGGFPSARIYSFSYLVTESALESIDPAYQIQMVDKTYYRIGPRESRLSNLAPSAGGYRGLDEKSGYQFLIDYREKPWAFKNCYAPDLPKCDNLADTVVLVGYDWDEDYHQTPLAPDMRGVEVHAHTISQLLRMGLDGDRQMAAEPPFPLGYGWILFSALLAGTYGTLARSRLWFGWGVFLNLAGTFLLGGLLLAYGNRWLPLAAALAAAFFAANLARWMASRWQGIFLSYAREDEGQVARVYACLRASGHHPWVDQRNLLGGDYYPETLGSAIRESDRFLACLSLRSMEKTGQNPTGILAREIQQALDEWNKRLASERYLVPVRLEPCEIPAPLARFNSVDFFKGAGAQALKEALRKR